MTTQWLNIGEDAGALYALLGRVAEHVPVSVIEDLWIFPSRRIGIGESIVVVVGAQGETEDRRRVITAHFTIARNKKGVPTITQRFDEHGTAPIGAMSRIVQGVLRRLGEDTESSPREEVIGGEIERWQALIVDLGGRPPQAPDAVEPGSAVAQGEFGDVETSGAEYGDPEPSGDPAPEPNAEMTTAPPDSESTESTERHAAG